MLVQYALKILRAWVLELLNFSFAGTEKSFFCRRDQLEPFFTALESRYVDLGYYRNVSFVSFWAHLFNPIFFFGRHETNFERVMLARGKVSFWDTVIKLVDCDFDFRDLLQAFRSVGQLNRVWGELLPFFHWTWGQCGWCPWTQREVSHVHTFQGQLTLYCARLRPEWGSVTSTGFKSS